MYLGLFLDSYYVPRTCQFTVSTFVVVTKLVCSGFPHLLNNYSQSTYYAAGIVPGAKDNEANRQTKTQVLMLQPQMMISAI